jgi:hypothetical protein
MACGVAEVEKRRIDFDTVRRKSIHESRDPHDQGPTQVEASAAVRMDLRLWPMRGREAPPFPSDHNPGRKIDNALVPIEHIIVSVSMTTNKVFFVREPSPHHFEQVAFDLLASKLQLASLVALVER